MNVPISGLLALVVLVAASSGAEELVPRDRLWAPPPGTSAPSGPDRYPELQPPAIVGRPGVGVMLPLSGRYQSFGESCLRGIRVALGAVEGRVPLVRTVVLDTHGEPSQAAAAYQKLATDPGIAAVLGPMLSPELDAVRPAVQAFDLPTINFSQRPVGAEGLARGGGDGLARGGGALFRFSLTKEDQARTLARYAVSDRGLRRWATLHPDDAYGREIAALFRQQVESLGGRVVADVGYEPGKSDLQAEAKRLQARMGTSQPLDGVFLPDSAARLALVASYLTYIDIRGVQLLGASGWDRPQELLAAMPYVNGGVFVDGFFLYSFRPEVRGFVDAFRDAYHTDPGALEAYGYDAAALVRDLMTSGFSTRQSLLGALHRPLARRGATGETLVGADGQIQKSVFLLKIEDGTIREIETPATAAASESLVPAGGRAGGWRRPEWDSRSAEDPVGGGR